MKPADCSHLQCLFAFRDSCALRLDLCTDLWQHKGRVNVHITLRKDDPKLRRLEPPAGDQGHVIALQDVLDVCRDGGICANAYSDE